MTTTREMFAIAAAAIEFELARRVANELRQLRASHRCEMEERGEPSVGYPGVAPCYMRENVDDVGRPEHPDDWCDPCRARQVVHLEYRKAIETRQRRMRALQRVALKGIDSRSIRREVMKLMADNDDVKDPPEPSPQGDGDASDAPTEPTETSEAPKTE